MINIFISTITSFSLILLVILLNTSTPVNAGPFGILLIFVLAYLFIIGVVTYLIYFLSRVISHLSVIFISRKPYNTLSVKRSYYYSSIVSAAPIMIVALQSVGSVGFYEYFLVTIFVFIGCLYISKKVN
ncbi:MAG: hypothetical protein WCK26_02520 [Candidatus Saccharibacteria bacterium]